MLAPSPCKGEGVGGEGEKSPLQDCAEGDKSEVRPTEYLTFAPLRSVNEVTTGQKEGGTRGLWNKADGGGEGGSPPPYRACVART